MFYAFQIECGHGISIERLGVLTKRPEGAELRGYRHWLHESFNWGRPLHQGAVEFFDVQVGTGTQRYCRVGKASEISRRCDLLKAVSPSVVINVKAPYPLYWWAPSLQIMEYEVFEKSTNRPLVYVSDILFGAGLAGIYIRFWKGDQDFDRVSCRYASTDIGPWRPSLSGRPRVAQYEAADLQLLLAAFP